MAHHVKVKNMVRFWENYRKLPAILAGKHPEYQAIHDRYWAVFTREMFTLMHTSFESRSLGGADSLGQSWAPLEPKTVKVKGRNHWGRGNPRKRVPPAQNPSQINVDTGDTLRSLEPGTVSGNTYQPKNSNQKVVKSPNKITLGTKCFWHPVVLAKRKWWGERNLWTKQAAKKAFEAVVPLLYLLGQ